MTTRELVMRFGSPAAVLDAPLDEVAAFAGPHVAEALAAGPAPGMVQRTLEWSRASDRHLLGIDDARYPAILKEIADPPPLLYVLGRMDLLQQRCLAIVGARNCTAQGARDAHVLAGALSDAGLCIVSGLALGIDAAAHRGGLEGASSSIAVMGTGADIFYPHRNIGLAREMARSGCIVTEFALGTPPVPGNFPRRNRLISGLARGVLVVEATEKSGSLGTARMALDQDRDVFARPGSIHSTLSKGCHLLIKQGAKLVENASDVLVEFGLPPIQRADGAPGYTPASDPLLLAMGPDDVSLDQMVQRTGLGAAAISAHLSRLEIDGRIEAVAGGRFHRVERPE